MSAYVESDGTIVQLDGRTEPDEVVTPTDVEDASKLARIVGRVLRDIAALKRRYAPRRIVFRDVVSTGTTVSAQTKRFAHGLDGKVHWWVADWSSTATVAPCVRRSASTTSDLLVLEFLTTGTATVIVEEAG